MARNSGSYDNPPGPEQRYSNSMSDSDLGYGAPGLEIPPGATLADLRRQLPWLQTWSDDDAIRVPMFDASMLKAGAIYADLHHLERSPFSPNADEPMPVDSLIIAKHEVPNDLWDRLLQSFAS